MIVGPIEILAFYAGGEVYISEEKIDKITLPAGGIGG